MSNTAIVLLWVGMILLILGSVAYLVFQIVKKKPVIKIIWRTAINVVLIILVIFTVNIVSGVSSEVISCVKERSPGLDGITYGQAIDNYLENAEWEFFASDTGRPHIVVEVNGECTYQNEKAKATIQFAFDPSIPSSDKITKDSEFELHYIGLNDKSVTNEVANELLNAAFQSYAVKVNIPYDDRPFFDEEENSDEDTQNSDVDAGESLDDGMEDESVNDTGDDAANDAGDASSDYDYTEEGEEYSESDDWQ